MIKQLFFVGLGGAFGSICRFLISYFFRTIPFSLPTLFINIGGSLLIGILIAYFDNTKSTEMYKLLLITGFCGGFTTFSTFSLESIQWLQKKEYVYFLLYIFSSITFCITATFIGLKIGKSFY